MVGRLLRKPMRQGKDVQWHALGVDEVVRQLATDASTGLSDMQVGERRRIYGPNDLPKERSRSAFLIFLAQFKNPLIFILVIASGATFVVGEHTDSIAIFIAVVLNTVIGYAQEYRATRSLSALKRVLSFTTTVVRNGVQKEVEQSRVVPGDVIVLSSGSRVPADARITDSFGLRVNESVLTGEWIAPLKQNRVLGADTALADRENMVFMGSVVEEGTGKAVLVATGVRTELGKIASFVRDTKEPRTPYQKKLARFSWIMGGVIAVLVCVILVEGLFTGGSLLEMFELTVAIAVGAIPEGLPVALTIVLAIGMQRILRSRGLVRHLASAETLGSASVIATDKTLTLTEGKMEMAGLWMFSSSPRERALRIGALASEAFVENPGAVFDQAIVRGRPTDQALLKAAMESGISIGELEREFPLLERIPFDTLGKYAASFRAEDGKRIACIAGSPESLLDLCGLEGDRRQEVVRAVEGYASRGLRVLALAERELWKEDDLSSKSLQGASFVGIMGLRDPLRKDAKAAIALARGAGIRVVIATGDHVRTAQAVARELGLPAENENVIEGKELELLSDRQLAERLEKLTVYARVEPTHKMRIIAAWQAKGEVVAMTGDGVNDAPALKKADIGIALGSGTDVAKEVSDLVLLKDDFRVIPLAIREGRAIVENMRKIITFLLSGTFTETILVGSSIVLGLPLPITALQILWINIIEDGLPAIAFTMERPEKDVMLQKPQKRGEGLLTPEMRAIIFFFGILTDIALLLVFTIFLTTSYSLQHIQSLLFVGLGLSSLFYAFSLRSLRRPVWEMNPFENLWLVGATGLGVLLLVLSVTVPFLQQLFGTVTLSVVDWSVLVGFAFLNIFLIEVGKWYYGRRNEQRI